MTDLDLIRIEHKLDLIIRALQSQGIMFVGLPGLKDLEMDNCPVCETPTQLSIDTHNERIVRGCGCELPIKVVTGISSLHASPEEENHGHHSRSERESVPPEQETGGPGGG
jgi:hypothetical protein